jgi:hypothetical protein
VRLYFSNASPSTASCGNQPAHIRLTRVGNDPPDTPCP